MMRLSRGFDAETMREALRRSGGFCECHRVPQLMMLLAGQPCGVALGPGNTKFEHIVCRELGGDNSVDNAATLTTTCWRLKTDKYDLPAIAQAKRRSDLHNGIRIPSRTPLPGGRGDPRKRTMAGIVVSRATGERWGGARE